MEGDRRGAMQHVTRLCVYCGSAAGLDHRYQDAARELGEALAKAGIELIFGGGRVGLMGVLADAVLAGGGQVVGIIPQRLRDAELAHPGAGELVIVGSMHERKRVMAERADAFAILPGGIGTLDETFESSHGASSGCTTSRSFWSMSSAIGNLYAIYSTILSRKAAPGRWCRICWKSCRMSPS